MPTKSRRLIKRKLREWSERLRKLRENPEYVAIERKRNRQRRIKYPERTLWKAARKRSKAYGTKFNLTESDIVIPKVCPVLGIILRTGNRNYNKYSSPSLERITPRKGYVRGNVIVISWRANNLRKDATVEELKKLARFYSDLVADHAHKFEDGLTGKRRDDSA